MSETERLGAECSLEERADDALLALPVVHLGLPKTGTTSLQRGLLSHHGELGTVGVYDGRPETVEWLRELHHRDGPGWTAEEFRRRWLALRDEAGAGKRTIVLSHEELAFEWHEQGLIRSFEEVAHRLEQALGSHRVLLVLREQRDLAGSLYAWGYPMLALGGGRCRDFATFVAEALNVFPGGIFSLLDFSRVFDVHASRRAPDALKVMCYEDLRDRPDRFVTELCLWLGVDVEQGLRAMERRHMNRRLGRFDTWRARMHGLKGGLGRTLYRTACRLLPEGVKTRGRDLVSRLGGNAPERTDFPLDSVDAFRAAFGPCNARIAEATGLDLASRGYLMPG